MNRIHAHHARHHTRATPDAPDTPDPTSTPASNTPATGPGQVNSGLWGRRAHSAVELPVAASLAPHERASAVLHVDRLREVEPNDTAPGALAALLLPHMDAHAKVTSMLVVKHLIERLQGPRLQALKEAMERLEPGQLMNFVFKRCPKTVRDDLLAHFCSEAPANPVTPYILSDIDNTVCPSRDARFPKSTISYPGRTALWRALLGPGQVSERTCFLSARFGEAVLPWRIVSHREREVTFANLKRVGITRPKVLFGSVRDLPYPTLRGINMAPLGAKKIKNFEMLRQVFPEYRYVFFGDTCEADLHVGQVMLEKASRHVAAVFIHDFGTAGHHWTAAQRALAQSQGVMFYKTAPGAALAAYRRGMLTGHDLQYIANEADREMRAIKFETPEQRMAAQKLLNLDLQAIGSALQAAA